MENNIRWSRDLAYATGLITTDGSLSSNGRHITFVSKDISLIKTFKCCLGLKNRIRAKKSGYSNKIYHMVQFGNVKLYKWLMKIGLMPNKTKVLGKLLLPNEYLADFVRGHLDGDGCIRCFNDPVYPKSKRLYTVFHSASLKHLKWLRYRIKAIFKVKGWIEPGKNVWRLTYAKGESKLLLRSLYYCKKAPCLKRKRKIAQSMLQ